MTNQKQTQKQRYSFDIRAGTTNQEEPITSIDKTVIAFDLDSVIEYCKTEYDMTGLEEINSDELSVFFEKNYLGHLSDHGNIHEVTDSTDILDDNNEVKEEFESEYGYFRDTVDISGGEITEKDYQYMISGNYWNHVIDLTEQEETN